MSTPLLVRLPTPMKQRLARHADRQDTTPSALAREAIETYIERSARRRRRVQRQPPVVLTVLSTGQITLPIAITRALDLQSGDQVAVALGDGTTIELRRIPTRQHGTREVTSA